MTAERKWPLEKELKNMKYDSAEKVRRVFRGSSWPCPNRYACFFLERWPDFSDAGVAEAARFICSVSRSSKVQ